MNEKKIITGIPITQQMSKARIILNSQIFPREEIFQIRKKNKKLSPELETALKANA